MKRRACVLSSPEIREMTRYWARRFKVHNWTLVVAIAAPGELARGVHGDAKITEAKSTAVIRIAGPDTFDHTQVDPLDMEIALVHELLHVRLSAFCSVERGSHLDLNQESATHELSKLLVAMRRSCTPRKKTPCSGPTS